MEKQSWFVRYSIGAVIIVIILTLIGVHMYNNYIGTKKFESFNSKLSYIEDRAWEMPELVGLGVYSAEEGLEELDKLTEQFEDIEYFMNYEEHTLSRTHLLILRGNLRATEFSLSANKQIIVENYVSGLS